MAGDVRRGPKTNCRTNGREGLAADGTQHLDRRRFLLVGEGMKPLQKTPFALRSVGQQRLDEFLQVAIRIGNPLAPRIRWIASSPSDDALA